MLLSRPPRALVLLSTVVAVLHTAAAQGTTNVTCTRNFWEYNDQGQSPCEVWALLLAVCIKQIIVTPISPGYEYYPPSMTGETDDCNCNVVSYNLMAACSWCQTDILASNGWVNESLWGSGCPNYDSTGIPASVEAAALPIPGWAFLPTNGNTWVPGNAQAVASGTWTAAPVSSTSAAAPTGSGSGGTTAGAPGASSTGKPGAGAPVGAIAGGAAGGAVALIGVALLVWYLLRRRQRMADPRSPVDLADPPEPTPFFLSAIPRSYSGAGSSPGDYEGGKSAPGTPWGAPGQGQGQGGYAYAPVSTGTGTGTWESGGSEALGLPRLAPPPPPMSVSALSTSEAASGSSTPGATAGHSPARDSQAQAQAQIQGRYGDPESFAFGAVGAAGQGREGMQTPAPPSYEQARAQGGSAQAQSLRVLVPGQGKRPRSGGSGR
ncbi:hypothetical protein CALCODRAFT_207378 [Calocera cornea HHB12733]|uniref:Transmembrane protein n=1 Tax=Calocera cornea HHB12733 TaxID=1353952 RepID=A0A165HCM8_9BASI|nr:hypothetical protein CALCODRAFT_207378 [Calocera cornea HHB12733]